MKTMFKKVTISILFLFLAIFLTVSTAFKNVEVFNKSELNNLSCGWPIQYASNGFEVSRWDPPYPWTVSCINGKWGDPVDINWRYFIFNVAFFYLLILTVSYLWKSNREKIRKKKQDHNES